MALEGTGRSLRFISIGFVLYVAFVLTARAWTVVGIWRSAGRHAARGGAPGWGVAARAMVVLGALVTLLQLPSLWLQAKEYGLIAVGRDPIGPMAALVLDRTGQTIQVTGKLSAGVADEFEKLVDAAPSARRVVLDSEGGRIFEALRMAELVRKRGLDTRVEEHCASACTLMLLAGKERSAHRFAQIGFHQPDFPGISGADRDGFIAKNRQDYIKAGVDQEFIDKAMTTPPEQMWYPSHADLVNAGVLTTSEAEAASDGHRLQQLLLRMERDLNASRGAMLDEVTRVDGARLVGNELRVLYGVTRTFSESEAEELQNNLTAALHSEFCDGAKRPMIEMGAGFSFAYVDPNGKRVANVTINKCPPTAVAG